MTIIVAMMLVHGQPALVLNGLDPIDLVAGKEVIGKQELGATYLRHQYRFSTEEHLDAFKKNPVRYAVQDGGACGKMGALTGKGSPDRFAVVRGKIFLFASDGCRTTMLSNPNSYFTALRKPPKVSETDRHHAQARYGEATKAHGGGRAKQVGVIRWEYEIPYKDQGKDKIWHTQYAVVGVDKFAQWERWDSGRSFFVVDGQRDAEGYPTDHYAVHPNERRALTAMFARHPVGLLKGVGGAPVATLKDGFTMVRDDIVFDVHLDPSTKRIARVTYRDRHAGPISDVVVEYGDYRDLKGIWLPMTSRTQVNGGNWSKERTVTRYEIGGARPQPFIDAFGK